MTTEDFQVGDLVQYRDGHHFTSVPGDRVYEEVVIGFEWPTQDEKRRLILSSGYTVNPKSARKTGVKHDRLVALRAEMAVLTKQRIEADRRLDEAAQEIARLMNPVNLRKMEQN